MNNKQFEEKVREVADEIWGPQWWVEGSDFHNDLIKFAKRFYELGEMG